MSGVVKAVSKVFKSVTSAVKKLWQNNIVRAIVIAAAIYFTGGLAAGAMGSASAAAMPGIAAAADTMGITAGAFSTTAAGAAEVAGTAGAAIGGAEMAPVLGTEAAATGAAATTETATGLLGTASAAPEGAGLLANAAPEATAGGDALAGTEIANTYAPGVEPTALSGNAVDAASKTASWVPKWFSDLPPAAQSMVSNAVVEGAKATYGAYAASEAEKEQERQRARFQNNQQPVTLTWNGAPAFQGGPKDAPGGMLDQAQPAPSQPSQPALAQPQTPITQEIGRAATGATPTATQRFAQAAPVSADEQERQRRLKTFQGGLLGQAGRAS